MIPNKIKFAQGRCAVIVKDFKDFAQLKRALASMGMLEGLVRKKEQNRFDYWRNLAELNSKGKCRYWYDPIVFEYQVGRGFSFYTDIQSAKDWYGDENVIRVELLDKMVEDWA